MHECTSRTAGSERRGLLDSRVSSGAESSLSSRRAEDLLRFNEDASEVFDDRARQKPEACGFRVCTSPGVGSTRVGEGGGGESDSLDSPSDIVPLFSFSSGRTRFTTRPFPLEPSGTRATGGTRSPFLVIVTLPFFIPAGRRVPTCACSSCSTTDTEVARLVLESPAKAEGGMGNGSKQPAMMFVAVRRICCLGR